MSIIKGDAKLLKSIHLFPNVITAFGLTCGLFIIFKMIVADIRIETEEILQMACFLFLLASFADLLDGTVARLVHAESEFGILFDSLADSITFGVAPSVVVLKTLATGPETVISFVLTISCVVYSLCGVLRLVRYSAQAFDSRKESEKTEIQDKHFTGLPIPGAGAAVMSLVLFFFSTERMEWFDIKHETIALILSAVMVSLGYFMISHWKFPSAKMLRFQVPTFQLVITTSVLAAMVLYGMLHHFSVIFLISAWAYILLAWGLSVTRLFLGRKSETLSEFEPEVE